MSHNILDSLTMSNPIESPINMAFEHCSTGDIGYLLAIVHPGGKPMDSWIAENPTECALSMVSSVLEGKHDSFYQ